MWNYFVHHLSFSPDALIGVGLILVYFVWMISMAVMRVRGGEHMHH